LTIRPKPVGGTFRDRHDTLGMGCDGPLWRQVIFTGRKRCSGRRSRVVLAPRPWRPSGPPVRARQRWQKKAAHRGEHEV